MEIIEEQFLIIIAFFKTPYYASKVYMLQAKLYIIPCQMDPLVSTRKKMKEIHVAWAFPYFIVIFLFLRLHVKVELELKGNLPLLSLSLSCM